MQKNYVVLFESKNHDMTMFFDFCNVLNEHGIHHVNETITKTDSFTVAKVLVEYADFGTAKMLFHEFLHSQIRAILDK